MRISHAVLALVLLAAPAAAQNAPLPAVEGAGAAPARVGPPVQRIESATAVSTEPLGMQISIRELPDGRVLVNDIMRRRLLMMDSSMAVIGVVLDSMTHVANAYGTQAGALLPHAADSTLFVDRASLAMVVIDPDGRPVRTRAVWRVEDLGFFASPNPSSGRPGVDARGRIVYHVVEQQGPMPGPRDVAAARGQVVHGPDSAFVVAVDVATRQRDTIATVRLPKTAWMRAQAPQGFIFSYPVINPLPQTDEWAMLADGSLAIVRGGDYSVEYLSPDGRRSAPVRIPFEWQRIADEEKDRMVDSVRTTAERSAMQQFVTTTIIWANTVKRPYPPAFIVPEWYTPQPGLGRDWVLPEGLRLPEEYIYGCAEGEQPTPSESGRPSCMAMPQFFMGFGGAMPQPTLREVKVIPASDLPDYRPAFPPGAVRADGDGNLWIQSNPPRPMPGGPVYDIVDRLGQLVNRLQLPPGYTLVGFGRGRVVYLMMRDAGGVRLARVRLRSSSMPGG